MEIEEFYKVTDAIEYPGDPERLLKHLDPGNVGYVNTRTLRILNEQNSEEKAVPQFLRKYAEHRQVLLDQKIASVVIPPTKELLAKQDSLRENCLEEWHTKREARNAKDDFIKALISKFGSDLEKANTRSANLRLWMLVMSFVYVGTVHSVFASGWGIAKAWRLALDPELKYAIENVDQLMKGLKRAGQMPSDGGEHGLRIVAEKIFQACQSKETEQITLDCLDPKTPAMMEKFKDCCEERFGSLQDAFEKVDVEGVGIVSREDFRLLCHEVKATDGIFRLMEFLDPKRSGAIRLALIDGEVTEDAMLATQTRRQMQKAQQDCLVTTWPSTFFKTYGLTVMLQIIFVAEHDLRISSNPSGLFIHPCLFSLTFFDSFNILFSGSLSWSSWWSRTCVSGLKVGL